MKTQEKIEPKKMVDVTVAKKNPIGFKQLPGGEPAEVAAVNEERFVRIKLANVEGGVAKRTVLELGAKKHSHAILPPHALRHTEVTSRDFHHK